ncbi:MAG: metalloregulator ArsR/SmtB family transcription factor [Candidatus Marsarchaeota archaeon]|jgi:DNA-binding transcriptional ArsR family regulator|nr:metalloregulator ArsR/SmtB family transcription factor [Candidatus Marsarchaeota archaeon]MCL5111763.1 metalloregulator ArsR/SmtB family transcription factor [Candidatus Marsarchaeota archaeon]
MDKLEFKAFFHAIGDYSRFGILNSLAKRDLNVSEIVAMTGIEQSNVSHHMHCLLNCGFVNVRKDGKERIYAINPEVRQTVNSIISHIASYKKQIISCDIANRAYISKVIK